MTFRELAVKNLLKQGIPKDQVNGVFEEMKNNKENGAMLDYWEQDVYEYPIAMQFVLTLMVDSAAFKYWHG